MNRHTFFFVGGAGCVDDDLVSRRVSYCSVTPCMQTMATACRCEVAVMQLLFLHKTAAYSRANLTDPV